MPCQSYESNWARDYDDSKIKKLKAEADKLARIACKAMTALEEMGQEDFVLLKDDEVATWWSAHKEADRKEQERVAEQERRERLRAEALAKLSSEERELLGLDPKSGAKKKRTGKVVPSKWDDPINSEECLIDLESLLKEANEAWKQR